METIRRQYEKELKNLEITQDEHITMKLVTTKFKRKALKVHSDKTRMGDDEKFIELHSDYTKLIDALKECAEDGEYLEKTDLQNFF